MENKTILFYKIAPKLIPLFYKVAPKLIPGQDIQTSYYRLWWT